MTPFCSYPSFELDKPLFQTGPNSQARPVGSTSVKEEEHRAPAAKEISCVNEPNEAVEMSNGENNEGFWMGEQMRETDKGKAGDRKPPEPNPTVGLGSPPVTSESTRFPNAYAMQYAMRKFFVTRPGAFDQAIEDLKIHAFKNSEETAQSFWLLTEIDHWNNERERVVVITDTTLLVCKYDFIRLSCLQVQRIPLSNIDRLCVGQFTFPDSSLDKREGEGLRIYWDNLQEPSFLSRWNPWAMDIPYATFTEHPVKNYNERFSAICQMSAFTAELVQAVQTAQSKNPAPGRTSGVVVLNQPLLIDTYTGLMSFIGNRNKLGYSLARGSVGF